MEENRIINAGIIYSVFNRLIPNASCLEYGLIEILPPIKKERIAIMKISKETFMDYKEKYGWVEVGRDGNNRIFDTPNHDFQKECKEQKITWSRNGKEYDLDK